MNAVGRVCSYLGAVKAAWTEAFQAGDPGSDYYATRLGERARQRLVDREAEQEVAEPRLGDPGFDPACRNHYHDHDGHCRPWGDAGELGLMHVTAHAEATSAAGVEHPVPAAEGTTPGEYAAVAVREVLAEHQPVASKHGVDCGPSWADYVTPDSADHYQHFADWFDWREHVSAEIARRIDAAVGATPTPKPDGVPEKFAGWFQK